MQAGPKVPLYRDDLAAALNFTSDALRDLGRTDAARERLTRAVALAEALASAQPQTPAYRALLADALRRLARLRLDAGDAAGAVADARRSVALLQALPSRDGLQWFWLACARATLSVAVGSGGPGLTAGAAPRRAGRPGDGRPPPGRRVWPAQPRVIPQ